LPEASITDYRRKSIVYQGSPKRLQGDFYIVEHFLFKVKFAVVQAPLIAAAPCKNEKEVCDPGCAQITFQIPGFEAFFYDSLENPLHRPVFGKEGVIRLIKNFHQVEACIGVELCVIPEVINDFFCGAARHQKCHRLGKKLVRVQVDAEKQIVLGWEIAVEGTDGYIGGGTDIPYRRGFLARIFNQRARGGQPLFFGLLRPAVFFRVRAFFHTLPVPLF
jgi:hypothetical protein